MATDVEQALQQAISHHKSGNLEAAKSGYLSIINDDVRNPHAYHNLALIMSVENNFTEALHLLSKARNFDATVEQFWVSELKLLLKLKNWDGLITLFVQAVSYHRTLSVINCVFEQEVLGQIINSAKQDSSIHLVKQLKTVIKNDVLVDRLKLLSEMYPFAEELVTIAKQTFLTEVDKLKIEQYLSEKKYIECLDLIEKLLTSTTDRENFLKENRAKCLALTNRNLEAKRQCIEEINSGNASAPFHTVFAAVLAQDGNFRDAESNFKTAISIDPRYADAYFSLGKLYDAKGDLRSAALCHTEVLKLDDKHLGSLFSLAVLYHKAMNYDKAIAHYHKVLEINDKNYRCALNLAMLYIDREMYNDAKILIDHVGDNDESYFRHQVTGIYFSKIGDHGRAIDSFKKASTLNPNNIEVLHQTAFSYLQTGEIELALDTCVLSLEKSMFQFSPSWDLAIICMGSVAPDVARKRFRRLEEGCIDDQSKNQLLALGKILIDHGLELNHLLNKKFKFNTLSENSNIPNVITLKNYGRSGTGLFHSLIDNHESIITTPSIYFSEFFHPSNEKYLLQNGIDGIVDKLIEKYPVFFDSRRSEPVESIGLSKIYNFGHREGLLTLGANKDEHIEVDTEQFRSFFYNEFNSNSGLNLGNVFIALNKAYDRVVFPEHDRDKSTLFYHVHNPSRLTEYCMLSNLNPKNILLVREPLQSMESWITKPFNAERTEYSQVASRICGIINHASHSLYRDGNYFGLRLEDIKTKPEETLRLFCNFLGVPYSDTMLNMTSAGKKWWGDPASPDFHTEGSSPFGKGAINRRIGKIFSRDDLYFLEILLHPFKQHFNYSPYSEKQLYGDAALCYVEKHLNEPLDFELMICEKNSITPKQIKETAQFKFMRTIFRNRYNELKSFSNYRNPMPKLLGPGLE